MSTITISYSDALALSFSDAKFKIIERLGKNKYIKIEIATKNTFVKHVKIGTERLVQDAKNRITAEKLACFENSKQLADGTGNWAKESVSNYKNALKWGRMNITRFIEINYSI
jgi:hypothetical protein